MLSLRIVIFMSASVSFIQYCKSFPNNKQTDLCMRAGGRMREWGVGGGGVVVVVTVHCRQVTVLHWPGKHLKIFHQGEEMTS